MNENKANSEKELLVAIKDLLKKSGHLNKLQAEMRAKVTEVLQEKQLSSHDDKNADVPIATDEVLLVNELVREYLEWNGYLYTASVLASEAALPKDKKCRTDLCTEVGVRDDEKSAALPLLSNIVAAYTERIKRKINRSRKD
ncbi:unnamed protein product [Diatraea saccharalis]|uniref:FGFR1 oncogene partner (FOP) N-terminal dimerisation domain-containing protein n=1 Tax=Diatraea saccharalis TaxID=40085 RepID=A0A9N9WH92_9NEOP|nr:unnamed protein product [Diatraea saccharalis]